MATGEQIEIATDDGAFDAYLSASEQGRGPGVVMVSALFGVDQGIKEMCDELAQRGCVALAPNFFWRDQDPGVLTFAEMERAVERVMRVDFTKAMGDLARGIAEVRGHPHCNGKIAVFGFCFGGPYAWRAACDGLGINAAVSFHGTFVSKVIAPGDQPKCPVSFHYGDNDDFAPQEELEAVRKVAAATGSEFVIHPGAGHGFMLRGSEHYHAQAARDAWNQALDFLDTLRT